MDRVLCIIPVTSATFTLMMPEDIRLPDQFDVSFVGKREGDTLYSALVEKKGDTWQMTKIMTTESCKHYIFETIANTAKEGSIVMLSGYDAITAASHIHEYRRARQANSFGLPICDLHFDSIPDNTPLHIIYTEP